MTTPEYGGKMELLDLVYTDNAPAEAVFSTHVETENFVIYDNVLKLTFYAFSKSSYIPSFILNRNFTPQEVIHPRIEVPLLLAPSKASYYLETLIKASLQYRLSNNAPTLLLKSLPILETFEIITGFEPKAIVCNLSEMKPSHKEVVTSLNLPIVEVGMNPLIVIGMPIPEFAGIHVKVGDRFGLALFSSSLACGSFKDYDVEID